MVSTISPLIIVALRMASHISLNSFKEGSSQFENVFFLVEFVLICSGCEGQNNVLCSAYMDTQPANVWPQCYRFHNYIHRYLLTVDD